MCALFFTVSAVTAQPAPAATPAQPELPAEAPLDVPAAIELYRSARYDDCAKAFGRLFASQAVSDADTLRARYHHIACLVGAHDLEAADAVIRTAVRENPQLTPDRRDFPAPVVDRYQAVRNDMVGEIERQQQASAAEAAKRERAERAERERKLGRLRRLAESETIIEPRSRWIAGVPFGVGQFQNDDQVLGWTFLVTETLLLAGLVTAITIELDNNSKADEKKDLVVLSANLKDARVATTVTSWGLLGFAALGILEAQLSFEPERRSVRKRRLPPDLSSRGNGATVRSLSAGAVPLPGGAAIGLGGTF